MSMKVFKIKNLSKEKEKDKDKEKNQKVPTRRAV
jgi:hypothetical protein